MPLITLETDPTIYSVQLADGSTISIDGLVLESHWLDMADQTDRDMFVDLVRSLATPKDQVDKLDKHQLYAFGGKVLHEVRRLGKDAAESPDSPESTGSDS